jgi:hypothetical protein
MMFETLYFFLLRHKQISLPEIGVVSLEIHSAKIKFIDRQVLPPVLSFGFSPVTKPVGNRIFSWLSHHLAITHEEAKDRFAGFISDLKKQLQEGKEIIWRGVGKFSKGLMNEVVFEPEKKLLAFQEPVVAEKVIRENVKHVVVVGEREKTGSDISEIMAEQEETIVTTNNWWIWPVALIVLSLIFLAWYFSENGIRASSSSNTEKSVPKEPPPGFYFSK